MNKEKKPLLPNEASWLRWIAFVVVGILIGSCISAPVDVLMYLKPAFITQGFLGEIMPLFGPLWQFAALFIGALIAMKLILKTSVRDFIYGVGGKGDRRQNLLVLGLYLLGMVVSVLPFIGNIVLRPLDPAKYLISFVLVLLFTWMQTSWEEIIFRGVFIRFACKNTISCTTKAVVWGVISSLIFMAMHLANPEVLSQGGFQLVLVCMTYFLSGMGLYFANIYFKSLMPGLIIHWINNFLTFTVISSVVAVGGFPSLFVDTTPPSGFYYLVGTALCYLPLYIYILVDILKKRKAA